MTNFWSLPKPVREKIYRMHLVSDEPVDFGTYVDICGVSVSQWWARYANSCSRRMMPCLLKSSQEIDREAAHIFFGENTFLMRHGNDVQGWFSLLHDHHASYICRVTLGEWVPDCYDMTFSLEDFDRLRSLPRLECLTVIIDEKQALGPCLVGPHSRIAWHRSLKVGPQMSLHLLRADGITALRSLRNLRSVDFQHPNYNYMGKRKGSIPDGVLETMIKSEIQQPCDASSTDSRRKGCFRFLELPLELRNIIYKMFLTSTGATFPYPGDPTSIEIMRHSDTAPTHVPHSALAMLCVNRQIQREAHAFFYFQNDLVFATPLRLKSFLLSLGQERLNCLRNVTFHYKREGTKDCPHPMDSVLSALSSLRGLRKLHILLPPIMRRRVGPTTFRDDTLRTPHGNPARLAGAKTLFSFRGLTDIKVFGPQAAGQWTRGMRHDPAVVNRLKAIFRHFNHGLRLAQRDQIFPDLYTNERWAQEEQWPALGTQHATCGLSAGCLCVKTTNGEGL